MSRFSALSLPSTFFFELHAGHFQKKHQTMHSCPGSTQQGCSVCSQTEQKGRQNQGVQGLSHPQLFPPCFKGDQAKRQHWDGSSQAGREEN